VLAETINGYRLRNSTLASEASVSASDPWASYSSDPWGTPEPVEPDTASLEGLIEILDAQKQLLISVATGGERVDDVNKRYIRRRKALNDGLRTRGIKPPFPYEDLWSWYGHWSAELGTYAQRRVHITGLTNPVREQLEAMLDGVQVSDPGGEPLPTWASLDARVEGIVNELRTARTTDDYQDVGRRCREVLIDTAKLLADPSLVPAGQEPPQSANAKAWLDLFLASRAAGRSHAELRKFIPAAWDLAQKVTHGGVRRLDAYAAAQATVLVVRTLQQLASEPAS
jgi:hypothetical protein